MKKTIPHILKIIIVVLACLSLSFTTYAADTATTFGVTPVTGSVLQQAAPTAKSVQAPEMVPVIREHSKPIATATPSDAMLVAKVVWVKGAFKATSPDKKSRTLTKKADPIYLHDTLTTGPDTQAQIVFTDNTLMTFRPNSTFYIDSYKYDGQAPKGKSAGSYIMNLLEGGFRTITGLIAKANPSDYKVNTPVATIGVRGTDYAVVLKNGQLFVGYFKGSPCVSSKDQTLCLDKNTPYAEVPSANAAPVPLTQQPPELGDQQVITNTTYTDVGGGFGSGGGGGGGVNTPPSATDILNSFCIQ